MDMWITADSSSHLRCAATITPGRGPLIHVVSSNGTSLHVQGTPDSLTAALTAGVIQCVSERSSAATATATATAAWLRVTVDDNGFYGAVSAEGTADERIIEVSVNHPLAPTTLTANTAVVLGVEDQSMSLVHNFSLAFDARNAGSTISLHLFASTGQLNSHSPNEVPGLKNQPERAAVGSTAQMPQSPPNANASAFNAADLWLNGTLHDVALLLETVRYAPTPDFNGEISISAELRHSQRGNRNNSKNSTSQNEAENENEIQRAVLILFLLPINDAPWLKVGAAAAGAGAGRVLPNMPSTTTTTSASTHAQQQQQQQSHLSTQDWYPVITRSAEASFRLLGLYASDADASSVAPNTFKLDDGVAGGTTTVRPIINAAKHSFCAVLETQCGLLTAATTVVSALVADQSLHRAGAGAGDGDSDHLVQLRPLLEHPVFELTAACESEEGISSSPTAAVDSDETETASSTSSGTYGSRQPLGYRKISLCGRIETVNAAMQTLSYLPPKEYAGPVAISVLLNDGGNFGVDETPLTYETTVGFNVTDSVLGPAVRLRTHRARVKEGGNRDSNGSDGRNGRNGNLTAVTVAARRRV